MNFKTTLLLLALLSVVGLSLWLLPQMGDKPSDLSLMDSPESPEAPEARREGQPLFAGPTALATSAIDQITIQFPSQPDILIQKQGSAWNQTQPVRFPLNDWKVSELLTQIAGLRVVERFTASPDGSSTKAGTPSLDQLGLQNPQATVTLSQSKDKNRTVVLRLGRSLVGSRAYLMIQGDPQVLVVPKNLHTTILDSKIADWRKRTLDLPTVGQLDQIQLSHPTQNIPLIKNQGRWVFAPPLQGRVNAEAVQTMLNTLTTLSIDSFVADAPSDLSVYGLDHPTLTLSLHAASTATTNTSSQPAATVEPSHRFLVGAATIDGSKRYVTLVNLAYPQAGLVVFQTPAAEVEKLRKEINDLRDPHITILPAGELRQVQVQLAKQENGDPHYTLLHSAEGWSFAQPGPEFQVDGESVSNLLKTLREAKATGYEPLTRNDHPPLATFTLTAIGQSEPEVIRIYTNPPSEKTAAETYRILRNQESILYQVPASQLADALKPAYALRDRTILDLKADQITGLTIQQPIADLQFAFTHRLPDAHLSVSTQPATASPTTTAAPADTWELHGQTRFEKSALDTLLARLAPLRAVGWVAPLPQGMVGMARPDLMLDIQTAGGKTHNLIIWSYNRQAHMDGLPRFELDQAFIDALKAEFRYRTLLPIAASDIQSLTLITENQKTTLRKNEQDQYVSDSNQPVNQNKAAGLFDTLAGLRVERHLPDSKPVRPQLQLLVELKDGRKLGLNFPAQEGNKNSFSLTGDLGSGQYELSPATAVFLYADPIEKK